MRKQPVGGPVKCSNLPPRTDCPRPLLWVPLTFLHPAGEPFAGIADETGRWLLVHIGQLVLTPFLAAGVWLLLNGMQSVAAQIARAALVLWMVFFSAFDAVAGIATGVLARHANSLSGDDRGGVVAATDFLFDDSQLVGGGFSVLGNLGHGAWIALAIAATVALPRAALRVPGRGRADRPLHGGASRAPTAGS